MKYDYFIATLLSGLSAFTPAMAQSAESEWKLGYTTKLSDVPRGCIDPNCKSSQQEFVSHLVKVCMYRDKATSGLFSRGDWKVALNSEEKELCQEVLFADISAKLLYLEAPLMKSTGMFLAGQQYIHCTPTDGRGDSSLCSPARPMYCKNPTIETRSSGYDPCSSEFFTPYEANSRYRVLQPSVVGEAVRESKLIAAIDLYVAEEAKRSAEEAMAAYRFAFENAKTLGAIEAFEAKYVGNDPEGFIAKLAAPKRAMQIDEYRQRFASMKEVREIDAFITDYANNDPDGKLPEARRLLASENRRVAAEAKKVADERSASEKAKSIADLERQIIWCKRQSSSAQQAIDRENKIGRISGYVNKLVLRQAGEIIASCDESIPQNFAEYKRIGGMKSLAALK